jgi:NAD-dependent deacetylase
MHGVENSSFFHIVILSGAGISKESGLSTFRDADGIWNRVRVEDVATPQAFARNPDRVHEFYNERRRQLLSDAVRPNAAHIALAELEQKWIRRLLLVTQNVDDLHERAGSRNLLHMHGELLKARCNACRHVAPCREDLSSFMNCPCCNSAGSLRPHVVWFGEIPFCMDEIATELAHCDLFVSIGTSGSVYPAAGFVEQAKMARATVVELNAEPSVNATRFMKGIYGPATRVVPQFVQWLLDHQA